MTRLALLTVIALVLTALPSRSALPPPEAGIGPVPFRPERFHDFRNDEPVADPFTYQRPAAVWPLMRGCSDPAPCRYLFGTP
jgi:hypothetical protein